MDGETRRLGFRGWDCHPRDRGIFRAGDGRSVAVETPLGRERWNKPHSIPFVALGTGLLWFGWFGFNSGSALGANTKPCASINSEISASAALFGWMMFEWVWKASRLCRRISGDRRFGYDYPGGWFCRSMVCVIDWLLVRAILLRLHRDHEEVQTRRRFGCLGRARHGRFLGHRLRWYLCHGESIR